jgi:TonB family protein
MSQSDARLIFDWERRRWDYRLPVLIAVSFFAHVFCFYLFRVVYPATTALLPPSAQVTVLDPDRAEDKQVLDWVTMNDPAKLSAPGTDSDPLSKVALGYRPIYSGIPVPLRSPESSRPKQKSVPSIFSTETLLPIRGPLPERGLPVSFPTRFEIGSTLGARIPATVPEPPGSSTLAEPTSIFVGVNPEGMVDYLFLMQSSGKNSLDQQAEDFVRKVRFRPAPNRDWGIVKFRWGGKQQ